MPCDCPDYVSEMGGTFCDGDDLYDCMLACMENCGCSCVSELVEQCAPGACVDEQDANAYCADVGGHGGAGGQGGA
jgi:hypothetical protein